jgi:hypothetical protein
VWHELTNGNIGWALVAFILWILFALAINGPVILTLTTIVFYARTFRKYRW